MNILDKLGFTNIEFGNSQTVDEMTIIPIVGEDISNNISNPENIKFKKTSSYGSMVFTNIDNTTNDNDSVGMSSVGIIQDKTEKTYNNACCIQSSQGGMIDGSKDNNNFDILPIELRKKVLLCRNERSYSKLWESIGKWVGTVPGIKHGQHLEYFFNPFRKELNDFVSEFEPVNSQLGALIYFNDILVGIEIMPTVLHYEYYWKWLIRGCYGAELLRLKKSNMIQNTFPNLILGDNIEQSINSYRSQVRNIMLDKLNNVNFILSDTQERVKNISNKVLYLNNGAGGGDILYEDEKPIYLSVV